MPLHASPELLYAVCCAEGVTCCCACCCLCQAVKRLQAQHRLVLSGTPIQNSALELWSLFDFLMPGFLGGEGAVLDIKALTMLQQDWCG